jgi:GTP-binding protein
MKIETVKFIKSVNNLKDKPTKLPEICFVGRSNSGKSSLINMILSCKIAKVSSTPGKTRFLNYYLINDNFYIVDMPGYGYAKVSKDYQEKWKDFLTSYLKDNENLKLVFQLIDIRHDYKNNDKIMINFLEYYKIPYIVLLTKTDKLGQQRRNEQLKYYETIFKNNKIILTSSEKSIGKNEILNEIKITISDYK